MRTHNIHSEKLLAENREASFRYEILERLEAGIVLSGQEVKSAKSGRINMRGAFVTMHGNEAYLTNAAIPPWQPKNAPSGYDEQRPRKLLLHKSELKSLTGKLAQKGLTAIPLRVYTKHGKIKIEIGVVKYKKIYDRRETIKKREAAREIARTLKYK